MREGGVERGGVGERVMMCSLRGRVVPYQVTDFITGSTAACTESVEDDASKDVESDTIIDEELQGLESSK